jgi:hypothetical protein
MPNWSSEELLKKLEENPALKIATDITGGTAVKNKAPQRQSKYHSTRTEYNGVVYHSKKEAEFAYKLDCLINAGQIDFWLRQVPFLLAGRIIYRADFVTFDYHTYENGMWVVKVYEVKGYKTKEWVMKEKLFREKYPNLILEVV